MYCFKSGRVTVPPTVALVLSGFGNDRSKFDALAPLRLEKKGKTMRETLRGGWKADNGGSDKLGKGFWSLGELDVEGNRRAEELRRARDVMDSLAGR